MAVIDNLTENALPMAIAFDEASFAKNINWPADDSEVNFKIKTIIVTNSK